MDPLYENMKIGVIVFALVLAFPMALFSQNVQWEEKFMSCHNGIQDGSEDAVDCYKVPGMSGCSKCNGTFEFELNGTSYKIAAVDVLSHPIEKSTSFLIITLNTYTDGTLQSGLGITFTLQCNPLKEDEYILKKGASVTPFGLKHGIFTMNFNFKHMVVENGMRKIEKGKFIISSMDRVQRVLSGTFEVEGITMDSTPINMRGTFSGVSY